MVMTTALVYSVMRKRWDWSAPLALLMSGAFLVLDSAFFAANMLKIADRKYKLPQNQQTGGFEHLWLQSDDLGGSENSSVPGKAEVCRRDLTIHSRCDMRGRALDHAL